MNKVLNQNSRPTITLVIPVARSIPICDVLCNYISLAAVLSMGTILAVTFA